MKSSKSDICPNCSIFIPKKITLIFDIIVQNSRNSRLEQAKIVYIGHYLKANFLRDKI